MSRAAGESAPPSTATPDRAQGWQRVIVELRLAGDPGPPAGAERRWQIAEARARLLASLPAGEFRSAREYETLPFVALEVSPAGLVMLRASPLVAAISPDRLEQPQGGAGGAPARGPR